MFAPLLRRLLLLFSAPSVPSSSLSFSHRIGQKHAPAKPCTIAHVDDIHSIDGGRTLNSHTQSFRTLLLVAPMEASHEDLYFVRG
ncbi:hypothetical protein VTO73DRAFT_402 [Trametes versicolor]